MKTDKILRDSPDAATTLLALKAPDAQADKLDVTLADRLEALRARVAPPDRITVTARLGKGAAGIDMHLDEVLFARIDGIRGGYGDPARITLAPGLSRAAEARAIRLVRAQVRALAKATEDANTLKLAARGHIRARVTETLEAALLEIE